ncbi:MAG: 16S rRNA (uracil(1498)-N(3))-methyltransferase [gamma proteobacterium symbiont of Lucinoma myriamae]|nr:16S rRNA (uracil(1498)-N(3))-methyltransferase [gamma proteobacterium symbiont of Lucinoma myriamae]
MRLSRFFIDEALSPGQSLIFPPHLVNYIVNVLRLKKGADVILFNGQLIDEQNGEFTATLTEISKRNCVALIENFIVKNIESPINTHLFQGISRSERMDYTIQKAVELGISCITPVFTQRSNLRKLNDKQLQKKRLHWQGVATSACEQSGRTTLVNIMPPIQVEKISEFKAELNLLLSPTAQSNVSDLQSIKAKSINIFIGPEGGLSSEEIDWAVNQDFQEIKLGNRVLRTETAGLVILSILQFLWGDLGI